MLTEKSISVKDLRMVIGMILDSLEEEELNEFSLSHDFYWNINAEQKYDPYKKPGELTIGQLTDDLETMKSILKGEKSPIRMI